MNFKLPIEFWKWLKRIWGFLTRIGRIRFWIDQLQRQKEWAQIRENYFLINAPGGAMVYKSKGSPEHYICPACYANKQHGILQPARDSTGESYCPTCNARYPINPQESSTGIVLDSDDSEKTSDEL